MRYKVSVELEPADEKTFPDKKWMVSIYLIEPLTKRLIIRLCAHDDYDKCYNFIKKLTIKKYINFGRGGINEL